jgi:hypothetical protein
MRDFLKYSEIRKKDPLMGPRAQHVIIARLRKGFDPVEHAQGVELTLGDNLPAGDTRPQFTPTPVMNLRSLG